MEFRDSNTGIRGLGINREYNPGIEGRPGLGLITLITFEIVKIGKYAKE
jgi:hypothetical protein